MKRLTGKVAFVTGGSRGMGAAIAKRLAREGADVSFTHSGRNNDKANEVFAAIKAEGVEAMSLIADNERPRELVACLQSAQEALGKIDILVNNAGVFSKKLIAEYSEQEYDQMMNVNVKAVFIASQYAAVHMNNGGRIITIGSNMAERVSSSGACLYAMSKSALIGLTKGMARDLGEKKITVNLIQPGPVDTDMNPATASRAAMVIDGLAIKRYGTVEEIASLVSWFAGAESQFITGTAVTIDGGFNI
jgi:3-oxoacyl-[acyl-carrier protein] reductase